MLDPRPAGTHPFDLVIRLAAGASICDDKEFLKGVAGGNFLQKVAPGTLSNALHVLKLLWSRGR